ncbi:TPA: hypothetical protein P2I01_002470 [Aeromonas salmonicida]|nr:hypothetical protein [Aeromonas salmonicida]
MANKINALDKLFKSSKKKHQIIERAFIELEPKSLMTFSKVMYTKFPFKNALNISSAIENRTINNFNGFIPSYIKSASNLSIFYYLIGILKRNHQAITSFINLEKILVNHILYGSIDSALEILDDIEAKFGLSFWSITLRKSLININSEKEILTKEPEYYNTIDDILIKVHQNNIDDINSGNLINPEPMDTEPTKNELYSFYNYRVFGLLSGEQTFDIFHVIKYELNSTLIDLFKAFEVLCYITITGIHKGYESYYNEVLSYISSVDHYLLNNVNYHNEMSDYIQAFYDNYTLNDYDAVIGSLSKYKEFDPSRFKILSKSLSFKDSKLPEDCLYFIQSNLMADIYSKKNYFQSSVCKLSNLNLSLRGITIFNIIKHRINIESKGYFNEMEAHILRAELLLSKDNTPLKSVILSNHFSNYEYLKYEGATAKIFMNRGQLNHREKNERELKYHILELLKENKVREASDHLSCNISYKDNELSQLFIKIMSISGSIEQACNYFLDIYNKYPSAINYFITNEFYASLESSVRNTQKIETAICLYLCKDSFVDRKMNNNATGIAIGKAIRHMGLQHPSELPLDKNNWMHIFFLSDVCEKELLTKSWLYRTQSEAYDERIRICNILVSNKMGNIDKLLNESKLLSKRKVLEVAEKQVNSTKIYADKDYIINSIWDQLNSLYKDLVEKINDSGDILDNEIEKALNKLALEKVDMNTITSLGLNILPVHIRQYVSLGRDYKLKTTFQMIKAYTEEYCFGLKGLNTYLSTRIRHGTLESTITSNLVSNGFLPTDDNDEDKQFYSILKDSPDDLIAVLKEKRMEFKGRLYLVINEIINDWVQICIDAPSPTIQKFNFYLTDSDLIKVAKKIEASQSFNECCTYLDEFIDEKLSNGCLNIMSDLDIKSRSDILNLFDEFEGFLYKIQSDYHIPFEFHRLVTSSKQHALNQLDVIINWFRLKQDFHEENYDMEIVTGIIKNMVQIENIKLIDDSKIKITYDILSSFVDIIYNLVNNAIKYSYLHPSNVKIEIICSSDIPSNSVRIEIRNNCACMESFEHKNIELKKYSEHVSSADLKMLMQREGGNTGIARVKSGIRYELNAREDVTLCYLSKDNFSASVSFKNAKGLSYD